MTSINHLHLILIRYWSPLIKTLSLAKHSWPGWWVNQWGWGDDLTHRRSRHRGPSKVNPHRGSEQRRQLLTFDSWEIRNNLDILGKIEHELWSPDSCHLGCHFVSADWTLINANMSWRCNSCAANHSITAPDFWTCEANNNSRVVTTNYLYEKHVSAPPSGGNIEKDPSHVVKSARLSCRESDIPEAKVSSTPGNQIKRSHLFTENDYVSSSADSLRGFKVRPATTKLSQIFEVVSEGKFNTLHWVLHWA